MRALALLAPGVLLLLMVLLGRLERWLDAEDVRPVRPRAGRRRWRTHRAVGSPAAVPVQSSGRRPGRRPLSAARRRTAAAVRRRSAAASRAERRQDVRGPEQLSDH